MNNVALIGRLVKDPDLRYIPNSGKPVATFTLAIDKNLSKDKKLEMESKNQPTADFIRIVVWGKQGENAANYLEKGKLTGIQGRIQSGSYDRDDGTKVFTTEVVANNVEYLEWGDKKEQYDAPDGFHDIDNDDIPF